MTTTTVPSTARARSGEPDRLSELLGRAAGGDAAAFALLYAQTAQRSYVAALQLLRDRHLAEDATQEAYLTVWRTAARFDPDRGSCLGWILLIVRRTAITHVRTTHARHLRDDRTTRGIEALRAGDPTWEQTFARLEVSLTREALTHLPPPQREALELTYFADYSHREVAVLLDLPLGTVKSRVRDGLIRLRESLQHLTDAQPTP